MYNIYVKEIFMPTPKKAVKKPVKVVKVDTVINDQPNLGDASTEDSVAEWSGAQDGDTSDKVAEMPELGP